MSSAGGIGRFSRRKNQTTISEKKGPEPVPFDTNVMGSTEFNDVLGHIPDLAVRAGDASMESSWMNFDGPDPSEDLLAKTDTYGGMSAASADIGDNLATGTTVEAQIELFNEGPNTTTGFKTTASAAIAAGGRSHDHSAVNGTKENTHDLPTAKGTAIQRNQSAHSGGALPFVPAESAPSAPSAKKQSSAGISLFRNKRESTSKVGPAKQQLNVQNQTSKMGNKSVADSDVKQNFRNAVVRGVATPPSSEQPSSEASPPASNVTHTSGSDNIRATKLFQTGAGSATIGEYHKLHDFDSSTRIIPGPSPAKKSLSLPSASRESGGKLPHQLQNRGAEQMKAIPGHPIPQAAMSPKTCPSHDKGAAQAVVGTAQTPTGPKATSPTTALQERRLPTVTPGQHTPSPSAGEASFSSSGSSAEEQMGNPSRPSDNRIRLQQSGGDATKDHGRLHPNLESRLQSSNQSRQPEQHSAKGKAQSASGFDMSGGNNVSFDDMHVNFLSNIRDHDDLQKTNETSLLRMMEEFATAYSLALQDQSSVLDILQQVEQVSDYADKAIARFQA